jgi:hypothetical protein
LARQVAATEAGMTEQDEVDPRDRLAAELRAIASEMAQRSLSDEEAVASLALARSLRAGLQGPPRARWYDDPSSVPHFSSGARESFGDLSPIRGRQNPVAPPLSVERAEGPDGPRIVAHGTLSRAYEGPPHGVHGGIVAAMFDEVLGAVMGLAPPPGVTATLEATAAVA